MPSRRRNSRSKRKSSRRSRSYKGLDKRVYGMQYENHGILFIPVKVVAMGEKMSDKVRIKISLNDELVTLACQLVTVRDSVVVLVHAEHFDGKRVLHNTAADWGDGVQDVTGFEFLLRPDKWIRE